MRMRILVSFVGQEGIDVGGVQVLDGLGHQVEGQGVARIAVVKPGCRVLRYLQTLVEISAEKNSTVIFPVPIDWMKALMGDK